MKLEIPKALHRNAPHVRHKGYENTGQYIIETTAERVGVPDLGNSDVLDIGCGVRFAATLLNRDIPIKSYTGIETERSIVSFLSENVTDERFHFVHWDVYNKLYLTTGKPMSEMETLPVEGDFDIIWLFSVFTHQAPPEANDLLRLMRKHIRPTGKLVFTAFIDENQKNEFEDRKLNIRPLLNAYYRKDVMDSLICQNGWEIDAFYEPDEDPPVIHHCYICSPS